MKGCGDEDTQATTITLGEACKQMTVSPGLGVQTAGGGGAEEWRYCGKRGSQQRVVAR